MFSYEHSIAKSDPEVAKILEAELERQQTNLFLIPSENYVSRAVLQASGSVMTNKYAEGYAGKRYYNGCGHYDEVELLAIDRVKKIFGAEHANVQLHCGTSANMSVYYGFLEQGDKVMSMFTDHGGHLSHGLKINYSGRFYDFHPYGVTRKDGRIDYDEVRDLAKKVRPKLIVCGASAYPRVIDFAAFRSIADEVGALMLADIAHIAGLVAAGIHPSPVAIADFVSSTTHKTLRGPRGAFVLSKEKYAKDLDKAVFPGVQAGPLMHHIAAKAVCFHEAMQPEFKTYQEQIVKNAKAMADSLLEEGFWLSTGGTDNHLVLADVTPFGLEGITAANLLEEAGIVVNRNLLPFDTKNPMHTSGIRPGTPAATSRGMKEPEMKTIGKWISDVVKNPGDQSLRARVKKEVAELCARFPIYDGISYMK